LCNERSIYQLMIMISLQPQLLVEAKWESHALADVAMETTAQLGDVFSAVEWSNRRVAVAVGSRGIDQIATVARAAIDWLKSRGAVPFVIPAMGSHGGATPEGQVEVLASLGVTEQSVGAPIEAAMETIELGRIGDGARVLTSRVAYQADAVLIINRIKPHTDFFSTEIGSGLRKMCVIGLGKAEGASEFHREAARHGYEVSLKEISSFVLSKYRSVFGLALVEDAHHRLAHIAAVTGGNIVAREPGLIAMARKWMPSLPFKEIDLLIVDEMGKNISGAGMDTNIIERGIDGLPRPLRNANVRAIYVRSLTPESHGNAIGIGLADIVSDRLVTEMDKQATYTNALTAITPATARIPMHFPNDADCMHAALRVAGADPASAHVVRVRNTLSLDRIIATANYAGEISGRVDLEILKPPQEWRFTTEGDFDPSQDLL
jgi:hypothetical protein